MNSIKVRRFIMRLSMIITIFFTSGLLTACGGGGGGGGGNVPTDETTGGGNPSISENSWDKMVWDQGKWK